MDLHPFYANIISDVGANRRVISMFLQRTAETCESLRISIKEAAKFLGKSANIKHSASLDVISIGFRFEGWHALSFHLDKGETFLNGHIEEDWLNKTKWMFFLLESHIQDLKVNDSMQKSVQSFAKRMSAEVSLNTSAIMDEVCSRIFNQSSWSEVQAQDPLNSNKPLFYARTEFGQTDVMISQACELLYDELKELEPDYYSNEHESPESINARFKWAKKVIEKQPDFYPACIELARGYVLRNDFYQADSLISGALKSANKLLPKGTSKNFHEFGGNRVFHILLDTKIETAFRCGEYKKSLAAARKAVRINPRDGFGQRYKIPLIMLAMGDAQLAIENSKFKDEAQGIPNLIRSFASFALNDPAGFYYNLYTSIFSEPWLKHWILNQHPDDYMAAPRGIGHYKYDSFIDEYGIFMKAAYESIPGLSDFCKKACLRKEFISKEKDLHDYWKGFWQVEENRSGSYEEWLNIKQELTISLSF